jgi:hypothetical protein
VIVTAADKRLRSPFVFAIAFILIVSIFFAWTYATSIGNRLDYDARINHLVDIDGDGLTDGYGLDFDHYSGDANSVAFYRNTGNGHFQLIKDWHVPGQLHDIFAKDIDNDNHVEFIAGSWEYDSFFLVTFKDWKFEVQERPGGGAWADWLQFCDVDGDGRTELLTRSGLWTLENGSLTEIPMESTPYNALVADLDADGQDELFTEQTDYTSGRNRTLDLNVLSYRNGAMRTVFENHTVVQDYNEFRAIMPTTSIVFDPDRAIIDRTVLLLNETVESNDSDMPVVWNSTLRYSLFKANIMSWNGSYVIGPATILDFDSDATHSWAKTADLNRDGFPDLISRSDIHTIKVATSNYELGNLSYDDASYAIETESGIRIYCPDLDKDGSDDIVVMNPTLGKVTVLFNNGRGAFSRNLSLDFEPHPGWDTWPYPQLDSLDAIPIHLFFEDMDRDGHIDIVIDQTFQATSFTIFFGDGKGNFPDSLTFTYNGLGGGLQFNCSVQLDGDGKPDVAFGDSHTYVLLNDGSGRFSDGMAIPLFFSIFLGAGAFLVTVYPMARRNKLAWAGLQRDQLVQARFYNILGWIAVMAGFVTWFAIGMQFTDGYSMLLAFILYWPLVLLVPGMASLRRVDPKTSAAISLGAGWVMFLFGAFIAIQYSSNLRAAPNLDHLMFLTGTIAALTVLFVALSVWALRHFLRIISSWTERMSLPIPAELIEFLHTSGMKRHRAAWFGWVYSTGGGSGELLTVTRKTGFSATMVTNSGGVVESRDPAKLITELSEKLKERYSIKDIRSPEDVRKSLEAAREKGDAGKLLGEDPQHEVALTALFFALGAGAFFEITWVSLPTYWPLIFLPFIALAAFIATLLVVGPAASTRIYENAVEIRDWLRSYRIWSSDIKRVVPQKRFLFTHLGPFYDVVRPSYHLVETSDGKHFHISGESAFLLRQALGSAWNSVFDPAQYREFFGQRLAKGRLYAPSGIIGAAFVGLFMGWFLYGIFMFAMLMWTQTGNPWLDLFFSIVFPAVIGTVMLRLIIDSHARRIVETKAAMAARGPADPVFGTGRRARRFASAAGIAVAGELPSTIRSHRRVTSVGVARGLLALSIGILMLIPLVNLAPPQGHMPEDNFYNDVFMRVKDSLTISGETLAVNGDIVVNGSLTLKDCDVRMSGTFMVAGNLTIDHCRLTCPVGPGLYFCNERDSSILLSLDLRQARHAVLTFNERYQMTAPAKMGLWSDQRRLWTVTGTSMFWKNASVDISEFCGQAVYLKFAPSSWSESSHFDIAALRILTDRGSNSLTDSDITENGWVANQDSQGLGIKAVGGSVKISDSELKMNVTWTDGIAADRCEILITRTNLSSNGGLKATNSRLSVEDSTLNFTWANGFDLVNVSGTIKNNDISSDEPFILQPVSGDPCRLADSLVISGNRMHPASEFSGYGPAFEIHSSIAVVDAMELARMNSIDFTQVYITKAFILPQLLNTTGHAVSGTLRARSSWYVRHLDDGFRELSTGTEENGWEEVGSVYLSKYYDGNDIVNGEIETEKLLKTANGFQQYIINGTVRQFMGEGGDGLGYSQGDLSTLQRPDQRLVVVINLTLACDAELTSCFLAYESQTNLLECSYNLNVWGSSDSTTVTLSLDGKVLDEDVAPYTSAYEYLDVPIEELGSGTLTLEATTTGAPDLDLSDNQRSWTVAEVNGSRTYTGSEPPPNILLLDNASLGFNSAKLELSDPTIMIGRGGPSTVDIVNSTMGLTTLMITGNVSGGINSSTLVISGGTGPQPVGYLSIGADNWSLDGADIRSNRSRQIYSVVEFKGDNLTISNSNFMDIGDIWACANSSRNSTFIGSEYMTMVTSGNITGCSFPNTTVAITAEGTNYTIENNTFSGNSTVYVGGPVNISRFAAGNKFLNFTGDYVHFSKQITMIINDSWIGNLTSERAKYIYINYTSLSGSGDSGGFHDPEGKGIQETRISELYPTIGILNASGIFQIFEISYNMTIMTAYDNDIPYSGKIQFQDGSDLEVVLR